MDLDKLLTDIYGNTAYDLKITKDTINYIIERLQEVDSLDNKTVQKLVAILQPLISREKSLYDHMNTKRKLLLDLVNRLQEKNVDPVEAENFFEKYKTIDIYIKEEKQLDIREFMKERVPEIFTESEPDEGLTD